MDFYASCTIGETRPGWVVEEGINQQLRIPLEPVTGTEALPSLPVGWEWVYPSDLTSIGKEMKKSYEAELARTTTDHTLIMGDPTSPGTLHYIPQRGSASSIVALGPSDSPPPYGMHHPASGAICLFASYPGAFTPDLCVFLLHNMGPHIVTLLPVLDHFGAKSGCTRAWVFDVKKDSELVDAVKGTRGGVQAGMRSLVKEHLLGVAVYRPEEEGAELVDGQMWMWS